MLSVVWIYGGAENWPGRWGMTGALRIDGGGGIAQQHLPSWRLLCGHNCPGTVGLPFHWFKIFCLYWKGTLSWCVGLEMVGVEGRSAVLEKELESPRVGMERSHTFTFIRRILDHDSSGSFQCVPCRSKCTSLLKCLSLFGPTTTSLASGFTRLDERTINYALSDFKYSGKLVHITWKILLILRQWQTLLGH